MTQKNPFSRILTFSSVPVLLLLLPPTMMQAATGSLQVFITPAVAITNGALWDVDSGPLYGSGAIVSGLTPITHQVSYTAITDWISPADQFPVITAGTITTITGVYVPNTGSISVTISPASLTNAAWTLDSGVIHVGSGTVSGLKPGIHQVSYTAITDWISPADQFPSVTANNTTNVIGVYVPECPDGDVNINTSRATLEPNNMNYFNLGSTFAGGIYIDTDYGPMLPDSVSITGTLPPGISAGLVTMQGTFSTPGTYVFTMNARKGGCNYTNTFTFVVSGTRLSVAGGVVNVPLPNAPAGGPITLQTKNQLTDRAWTNVLTTYGPSLQLPKTSTNGFFRFLQITPPPDSTDYAKDRAAVLQRYNGQPYWSDFGVPAICRSANLQECMGLNPTNAFSGLMTGLDPVKFRNVWTGGLLPEGFSNQVYLSIMSGQPTNLAIIDAFRDATTNMDKYLTSQGSNSPGAAQIRGQVSGILGSIFDLSKVNATVAPETNKVLIVIQVLPNTLSFPRANVRISSIEFSQEHINWVDVHGSDAFTSQSPPYPGPGSDDSNTNVYSSWAELDSAPLNVSYNGACAALAAGAGLANMMDPSGFPQTVSPQFWNEFSMKLGASTTSVGANQDITAAYYQTMGFGSIQALDAPGETALQEAVKALLRGCAVTLEYLSQDGKKAHIELVEEIDMDPNNSQQARIHTLSWSRDATTIYDHGQWSRKSDGAKYGTNEADNWLSTSGQATFYYHCPQ